MVVPKIIICPICGKRIYLRIQNGGYLFEYPIRVYCLNCRALISGSFVMNPSSGPMGLSVFNAETEDIVYHKGSAREIDADYIAEISGELPCKKTQVFDGKVQATTPFLRSSGQLDMLPRIEELEEYSVKMQEWKKWKSIAFQLFDDGQVEYIPTAVHNRLGEFHYLCSDYLKSLHCLQEIVHDETRHIFTDNHQDDTIAKFIKILSAVDRGSLHNFISRVGGVDAIVAAYRKMMAIFSSFMQVYPNLLPAETFLHFKEKGDPNIGISTCSFVDIKDFYVDSYETLLSYLFYAVCLDNILLRGDYLSFSSVYAEFYKYSTNNYKYMKLPDDFARYENLYNGKRAELMNKSLDPIQHFLAIPAEAALRNAISHNSYRYDGLNQEIFIYDQKKPAAVKMVIPLLDMAVDCIHIAQSAVLFSELLLFVLRQEEQQFHCVLHPRYYSNIGRNDKCPCGSAKKYKNCCMGEIDSLNIAHEVSVDS